MRREEDRLVVSRRMVRRSMTVRRRMPSSKAVRISLLRSGMRGGNVWVVLWLWCAVGRRGWRMLVGGGLWRFWARRMGRGASGCIIRWDMNGHHVSIFHDNVPVSIRVRAKSIFLGSSFLHLLSLHGHTLAFLSPPGITFPLRRTCTCFPLLYFSSF